MKKTALLTGLFVLIFGTLNAQDVHFALSVKGNYTLPHVSSFILNTPFDLNGLFIDNSSRGLQTQGSFGFEIGGDAHLSVTPKLQLTCGIHFQQLRYEGAIPFFLFNDNPNGLVDFPIITDPSNPFFEPVQFPNPVVSRTLHYFKIPLGLSF
ncbi:MAG: hypothetical protein AAGD05_15840 [Bacteroidota bacterium]